YILDSYNDEGYAYYFEKYGFVKHRDYYAYQFNLAMFDVISAGMLSTRAQRRFGFSVSHADLCGNEADKSIRDIAGIIRAACPPKWETSLPDAASLGNEISLLKDLLVPELTVVAYAGDQPIGFLFVLPDYCGSCTGSDTVKNAFYAGNVSAARCCMQFVVPEYRHKAVNIAMFHEAFLTARKYGIRQIEAGQIDETNIPSLNYISRMNAKQTFTWRQYEKKL
ncbi:MAG: hypothetical protein CW338_12350, partial [Clostridiales bacterium]|nr:hypothetical protein [Clostridiales bacterium]